MKLAVSFLITIAATVFAAPWLARHLDLDAGWTAVAATGIGAVFGAVGFNVWIWWSKG